MPQGLRIWRGDKSLIFDVTTSLCRVLGNVDLTEERGKIYCDDRRIWATAYRASDKPSYPVKLTIVADGIEWQYTKSVYQGTKGDFVYGMRLMYGSY